MQLSRKDLGNGKFWADAGIELPKFNIEAMISKTSKNPAWIHFGAGNIFRGFIAVLQQTLLDMGKADVGVIAAETYDFEIIDRVYTPYDNLSLLVIMNPDGSFKNKVVSSVSESLAGDPSRKAEWDRLMDLFTKPSLQMVSMTITEKGYNLKKISGEFFPDVIHDMENGPQQPRHVMSKIAALAFHRYNNGALPVAFVSMDNCSENGKRFCESVLTIAEAWAKKGLVPEGFVAYLKDPRKITFPWSMIDKITPRPSDEVKAYLSKKGIEGMDALKTEKNTFIAPFVNAEGPQYLVVEDSFPNGRLPLELSGVIFTDRSTVDRVEKMKVGTCLNPLHTTLAVFGCLLGKQTIAQEMQDESLKKLVERVGFGEGLPVVINPGVIDPDKFIKEVIEVRLPNAYIPDTPQRIACDTSQKLAIRFGETIKAYRDREGFDAKSLTYIPLVIAGWCRYIMGLDDAGNEMPLSPDPMLDMLKPYLEGIKLGDRNVGGKLKPILTNTQLFGLDLYEVGLGEKIENYFEEMVAGPGAVRAVLKKYVG